MQRRKGFTLIELLVVISIIALLVSILLPTLGAARAMARRVSCATNLNAIGKALAMYQSNFETTPSLGGTLPVQHGNPSAVNSLGALQEQSIPQAYWLLVNSGYVGEGSFECPADSGYQRVSRSGVGDYGFDRWENISFAFQPTARENNKAYPGATGQSPGTYVAGDRLEFKSEEGDDEWILDKHSPNHGYDGTNLLAIGGNVKWNDKLTTAEEDLGKHEVGINMNHVFAKDMNSDGDVSGGTPVGDLAELEYPSDSHLYSRRK